MRYESDRALIHVVHSVVVCEQRHSQDVHRSVDRGDQKNTKSRVLIGSWLEKVVLWVYLDPLVTKEEVNSWQVQVARASHKAIRVVVVTCLDVLEDFLDNSLEVEGGNRQS